MSRSDRSLVVAAIVGLVTISLGVGATLGGDWTSKPYEQTQKPHASAERYAAKPLDTGFSAYPAEESNRCYGAKDHDSADLCAQWRAAIAAEKAADAAVWSNRLSIIGAIISCVGLALILITLQQGRRALKRAGRANRIARETARHELRAYLAVTPSGLSGVADRGTPVYGVVIKNVGSTPAFGVKLFIDLAINDPGVKMAANYDTVGSDFTLAPSHQIQTYRDETISLIDGSIKLLRSKSIEITVFGRVEYKDIFEEQRVTNFHHVYTGHSFAENDGMYSDSGNSAT